MSEKDTQRLIVEWLNLHGASVWLNEIPLGIPSKYSPTGRRRAYNRRTPDIVGALMGGRGCFLEVKKEAYRERVMELWNCLLKGDYSIYRAFKLDNARESQRAKEQAENLLWLRKTGAVAEFVFSLEDVQIFIETGNQ